MRDLPDRPIALTLFRATRRTVMTDGEPDGQLRGDLALPLLDRAAGRRAGPGAPLRAGAAARRRSARRATAPRGPGHRARRAERGADPSAQRRLSERGGRGGGHQRAPGGRGNGGAPVQPDPGGGAAILRLGEQVAFKKAQRVDLESNPLKNMRMSEPGVLRVPLKAKEIATVRLT